MSVETAPTSVVQSVDVAAPIEHAFDTFTQLSTWWDPTHHMLENTTEMVVEARVGGGITDVNAAGDHCTWGHVLVFDRPSHFAFSWDISVNWEVEPDPTRRSEVHVTFSALDERSTRVVLEHRHLDRHGHGWEGMRESVGSDNGWASGLARYAASVSS